MLDNACWSLLGYAFNYMSKMHVFTISLVVEGTTEKVPQFIMPQKVIYNRNVYLNESKCIFEHCRKVKIITISLKVHYVRLLHMCCYLLSVALSKLIFELHKVLLFKCL
jgi:hypothetical protein